MRHSAACRGIRPLLSVKADGVVGECLSESQWSKLLTSSVFPCLFKVKIFDLKDSHSSGIRGMATRRRSRGYFPVFLLSLKSCFSSLSSLRFVFLMSSAGGSFSGKTPRSINALRMTRLFSSCSVAIGSCPIRSFS